MANSVNTGKKLNYIEKTVDMFASKAGELKNVVEELYGTTGAIRSAAVDNAYNGITELAEGILDACNAASKSLKDPVLENIIKNGLATGPAAVQKAKALMPEVEAVIAATATEFAKVPSATISSRGLDENWTDVTRNQLLEQATRFMGIRKTVIIQLSEITSSNTEEDFAAFYKAVGANLETITNESVGIYNKVVEQLTKIDSNFAKAIEEAESSASKIAAVEFKTNGNIMGETMDI